MSGGLGIFAPSPPLMFPSLEASNNKHIEDG